MPPPASKYLGSRAPQCQATGYVENHIIISQFRASNIFSQYWQATSGYSTGWQSPVCVLVAVQLALSRARRSLRHVFVDVPAFLADDSGAFAFPDTSDYPTLFTTATFAWNFFRPHRAQLTQVSITWIRCPTELPRSRSRLGSTRCFRLPSLSIPP